MRKLFLVALCAMMDLCTFAYRYTSPIESIEDLVTFCTDDNELGISYPAGTDANMAFDDAVGCLTSSPSPQWFTMQIDQSGSLGIYISHSGEEDIDFACYGPFPGKNKKEMFEYISDHPEIFYVESLGFNDTLSIPQNIDCYENYPEYKHYVDSIREHEEAYDLFMEQAENECRDSLIASYPYLDEWDLWWDIEECSLEKYRNSRFYDEDNGDVTYMEDPIMFDINNPCFRGYWDKYPRDMMVDCSYSTSSKEICYIPDAKEGEWYLLLITNFSMIPGTISFNKTSGEATTNCSIIVDAYATGPYCEGETIELGVNNAPAGASFSWAGPNGFSSRLQNPTIPNASAEHAGTYTVVMVSNGHTSPEVEVEVVVNPKKEVEIEEYITAGDYYLFGGSKYYTAGTYTKTFTSVETGCDSIVTLNLKLEGVEPRIEQNGPYCEGETITMEVKNAPTGATFLWEGPSGFTATTKKVSISDASTNNAGSYSVTMNVNGKEESTSTEIEVFEKSEASISEKILFGESYHFGNETLNKTGTYTKTFTSKVNGCDSIVTLTLTVEALDPVVIDNNGPLCEEETLLLTLDNVPNNATYQWSGPNGFSSTEQNPTINNVVYKNSGLYTVKVSVNGQLADEASTSVVVNKIEKTSQNIELVIGETFYFGDEEIEKPGTYQQVYNGSNGCDSIVILKVRYGLESYKDLIPEKIITPNADGTFDLWFIQNVEYYEKVTVSIFDRFGKLLRKIEHYDNEESAWDGKDSQGRDLPSTDYWYLIYAPESDKVYKGHVSLIR